MEVLENGWSGQVYYATTPPSALWKMQEPDLLFDYACVDDEEEHQGHNGTASGTQRWCIMERDSLEMEVWWGEVNALEAGGANPDLNDKLMIKWI